MRICGPRRAGRSRGHFWLQGAPIELRLQLSRTNHPRQLYKSINLGAILIFSPLKRFTARTRARYRRNAFSFCPSKSRGVEFGCQSEIKSQSYLVFCFFTFLIYSIIQISFNIPKINKNIFKTKNNFRLIITIYCNKIYVFK